MNDSANLFPRVLLPLAMLALICAVLLVLTARSTGEGIAENRQRSSLRVISDIIPQPYDNDPLQAVRQLDGSNLASRDVTVSVHVARQGEQVQGYVFLPVTASGYNGPIRLAVGIHCDGRLSGVRVVSHRETEGLGARVDQRKSDWIRQFRGTSLDQVPAAQWVVAQRDGNRDSGSSESGNGFDGLSGATISSRGVIDAIRRTLAYYATSPFNCCRDQNGC